MKIRGQLVDIHNRDIYPCIISFRKGKIINIERTVSAPGIFILPGLIDSHIHIESSMITPGAFAMAAVRHGTTGVVSDPHEIANVLGLAGIEYMIEDAGKVPLKFWFGASSCVPATAFETSGAALDSIEIEGLLKRKDVKYLSEMMNFPGVISDNSEVKRKLDIAHGLNKPVDGHAPGLTGEMLKKYVSAGISTDHECSSLDEAKEKLSLGMKILLREGSAARNLDSLKGLYSTNPEDIMLCCDDLHPEMLKERHINKLIAGLIKDGFNVFDVIRSATLNPVKHYNLEGGLIRIGDKADFILVDKLEEMNVLQTWIEGRKVYENGKVLFSYKPGKAVNRFNCKPVMIEELKVKNVNKKIRVIEAFDGDLYTGQIILNAGKGENIESDIANDILKIVVKDRYNDSPPAVGFIKGFGINQGAFASSVAHDSHNIICVGTNDHDISHAINKIVDIQGGLAVASDTGITALRLDIAGIMTTRSCDLVAHDYLQLNDMVKSFGCKMKSPFMTLSFMALLVIPDLKIGDRGLFDVNKFELVSLFTE
jgi:adenine deaminase